MVRPHVFNYYGVQVASFNEWIGSQEHPIKLVIAGNHELGFDSPKKKEALIAALGGCQYVEDAVVQLPGAALCPLCLSLLTAYHCHFVFCCCDCRSVQLSMVTACHCHCQRTLYATVAVAITPLLLPHVLCAHRTRSEAFFT